MQHLLFVIALLISANVSSQVNLDPYFANNGLMYFETHSYNNISKSITDNDRIVCLNASGYSDSGFYNMDLVVSRFLHNGELDSTFGLNGLLIADFDSCDFSLPADIKKHPDGGYIILGTGYAVGSSGYSPMCLLKIDSLGKNDTSFGSNGTIKTQYYGFNEIATSLDIDSDTNFFIGGASFDTIGAHDTPVIAKLNASGNLDTTFGSTGRLILDLLQGVAPIRHIADGKVKVLTLLDNGSILVAGSYANYAFITKIQQSGQLDYSFNGLGYVLIDLYDGFWPHEINDLEKLPDGSYAFGLAVYEQETKDFYVGRINPTTGSYEIETIDFGGKEDMLSDLVLTSNQELVAVGRSTNYENAFVSGYQSDYFALARFPEYDQLDQYHTALYASSNDYQNGARTVVAQSNGRIVVGGFEYTSTPGDIDNVIIGLMPSEIEGQVVNSIIESNSPAIRVYPNPTSGIINFENTFYPIELWSLDGRLVYTDSSLKNIIDISHLSKGSYIVRSGSFSQLILLY